MTKVAFVVQRYGQEIIGGAESHCRHVAERLVKEQNWEVTVYTTKALNYVTWKNELHRSEEKIHGVKVKRFSVLFPRYPKIFDFYNHWVTPLILKLGAGKRIARLLGRILERIWIILQGPYCPSLVRALRHDADQYDKIFFFTYLYYPTIYGTKALKRRNFSLIPTAHRDPPFHFQHMRKLLLSCNRLLVNVTPEKDLIESMMGMPMPSIRLAGLGFDVPASTDATEPQKQPYILYLGRICAVKGLSFLFEAFQAYLKQHPESDLCLVLVGKQEEDCPIPDHDRIKYMGIVDDARKFFLIRQSLCVVNPSPYESLSMIAIEAMLCLKPLLLNKDSEVLHYYCQIIDTCYGFGNIEQFIANLSVIDRHDWSSPQSKKRLIHAKDWAQRNCSWESVIHAYIESPTQFSKVDTSENLA